MTTTPGPRYAPERTAVPPGTTRTPSATVRCRGGNVSLSKKRNGPAGGSSTTRRRRKQRRMPFLTRPLTVQPEGPGSAARMAPRSRPARNASKTARASAPRASAGRANSASTCSLSSGALTSTSSEEPQLAQGPSQGFAGLFGGRTQRQAEALLAEAEEGQGRFHRNRVRFHEVQVHEPQQPVVDAAPFREVPAGAGDNKVVHGAGDLVGAD